MELIIAYSKSSCGLWFQVLSVCKTDEQLWKTNKDREKQGVANVGMEMLIQHSVHFKSDCIYQSSHAAGCGVVRINAHLDHAQGTHSLAKEGRDEHEGDGVWAAGKGSTTKEQEERQWLGSRELGVQLTLTFNGNWEPNSPRDLWISQLIYNRGIKSFLIGQLTIYYNNFDSVAYSLWGLLLELCGSISSPPCHVTGLANPVHFINEAST